MSEGTGGAEVDWFTFTFIQIPTVQSSGNIWEIYPIYKPGNKFKQASNDLKQ